MIKMTPVLNVISVNFGPHTYILFLFLLSNRYKASSALLLRDLNLFFILRLCTFHIIFTLSVV